MGSFHAFGHNFSSNLFQAILSPRIWKIYENDDTTVHRIANQDSDFFNQSLKSRKIKKIRRRSIGVVKKNHFKFGAWIGSFWNNSPVVFWNSNPKSHYNALKKLRKLFCKILNLTPTATATKWSVVKTTQKKLNRFRFSHIIGEVLNRANGRYTIDGSSSKKENRNHDHDSYWKFKWKKGRIKFINLHSNDEIATFSLNFSASHKYITMRIQLISISYPRFICAYVIECECIVMAL